MISPVLLPIEVPNEIVGTVDLTLGGVAAVVLVWLALARRTRRARAQDAEGGDAAAPPPAR
jgi:hypothetical protein